MPFTFHLNKTDIVNLHFFRVNNPGQLSDMAIHLFVLMILLDISVFLFGNGDTAKEYTHIDDMVLGIYHALEYGMRIPV